MLFARLLARPSAHRVLNRVVSHDSVYLFKRNMNAYFSTKFAIQVPDGNHSLFDGEVIAIFKEEGDVVAVNDVVAIIEAENTSVDIRSSMSGIVDHISVKVGQIVPVGADIMTLTNNDDSEKTITPLKAEKKSVELIRDYIVTVPNMGDSITAGEIIEILKVEGDSVAADEVVAIMETDKVSIDVRSEKAGIVKSLAVKAGDLVEVGYQIMYIDRSKIDNASSQSVATPQQTESSSLPESKSTETKENIAEISQSKSPSTSSYQPSISFRFGGGRSVSFPPDMKKLNDNIYEIETPENAPFEVTPQKYSRKDISEDESNAINSGGAWIY